jgi:opacity protein-like surface antigen
MKRIILAALLATASLAAASAADANPEIKQPAAESEYEAIRAGDQMVNIDVGPSLALCSFAPTGVITQTNLMLGLDVNIGYSRFLTSRFALGGEINFKFHPTLGENVFFCVPVLFKASYSFVAGKFQIPLTIGIGPSLQTWDSNLYFGPLLKTELGLYYQFSPEWSFGVTGSASVIPEWYADTTQNRTMLMAAASAGLRYHF